jgi:hypothetical protein
MRKLKTAALILSYYMLVNRILITINTILTTIILGLFIEIILRKHKERKSNKI